MHEHPRDTAQKLLQAVGTLHQAGSDSVSRANANKWLETFEREEIAWQVKADTHFHDTLLFHLDELPLDSCHHHLCSS